MPRGVYDRTKTKAARAAEKAAGPAPTPAKKAPAKKPSVKAKPATENTGYPQGEKAEAPAFVGYNQAIVGHYDPLLGRTHDSQMGFQILGSNISTLTSTVKELSDVSGLDFKSLGLADELRANVQAMTRLREKTFASLYAEEQTPVATVTAPAPAPAVIEKVAPVLPMPTTITATTSLPTPPAPAPAPQTTLPQGNATFVPPAPPAIPHH